MRAQHTRRLLTDPNLSTNYNLYRDLDPTLNTINSQNYRAIYPQIGFEIRHWWKPVRPLGHGVYGDVFMFRKTCSNGQDGSIITSISAVKKVKGVFSDPLHMRRAIREVRIMHHLRGHPNIATLGEVDMVPLLHTNKHQFPGLYLFMECMDMDLATILKARQEVLTEWHVSHISYQLLSAVHYMHTAGIVHRDLKPSNILINRLGVIKICDFGLARGILADSEMRGYIDRDRYTDYVVTRWYRAPEILLKVDKYHYGLDMWSCGCIMVELVLRRPLFKGEDSVDQMRRIIEICGLPHYQNFALPVCFLGVTATTKQLSNLIPSCMDKSFIDLVESILVYTPNDRITAQTAMYSPFFDVVRESSIDGDRNDRITCPRRLDTEFEYAEDAHLFAILKSDIDKIQHSMS